MTDNGSAYRSKLFVKALLAVGARHVRTPLLASHLRKAERFIQASPARKGLQPFLYLLGGTRPRDQPRADSYNRERSHSGIRGLTPRQRVNKLLGNDI